MNIAQKTILITGGGSGIGWAIAQALSPQATRLLLTGRDQAKLAQAAAQLPNATALACDITDAHAVAQLVARVQTDFPELSVLINNAGQAFAYQLGAGVEASTKAAAEMATNYLAPVRLTELLLPLLSAQPEAAIVNVTSIAAFAPNINLPTYAASKAALHSYSQALRFTLAQHSHVRVFELMPPLVNTEFSTAIGGASGIAPQQVAEELLAGLAQDTYEIHVGRTAQFYETFRANPQAAVAALNNRTGS